MLWLGAPALAAELDEPMSQEQMEELKALGYLDFAPEIADATQVGVTHVDRERAAPGYSFYTSGRECSATLIDLDGQVIHEWRQEECQKWSHPELLPNGDLLVTGRAEPESGRTKRAERRFVVRLSPEGEVVWLRWLRGHHDQLVSPDGGVLVLTDRRRSIPELEGKRILDNDLVLLSAEGEDRGSLSLYDVTVHNEVGFELAIHGVRGQHENLIDLFHSNSIEWMTRPELVERHPLYGLDNILLSTRHQDSLFIVDWKERKLVWAWGVGVISGSHDATVLDNGHILLFDNSLDRKKSRALELDPVRREIVWEYPGEHDHDFFSVARGAAQRLPNGNTLITNSEHGEAFEVTRGGEIVWQFWNPSINPKGHRAVLVRMVRYPASFFEPELRERWNLR